MSLLNDPALENLLTSLHARSDEQMREMRAGTPDPLKQESLSEDDKTARAKAFVSDKLVALDKDKAEFCYQLCRSLNARRIVEIGTSFGVSTLYLAAAIRDNVAACGGTGVVIGTEYEPGKAIAARGHFAKAGLADLVELREGDLRETLVDLQGPIDFVLMDIWEEMARPALELVAPHLRYGAMVVCDNTAAYRENYAEYFALLDDPANGFKTITLPFEGGLELSVRTR